LHVMPQVMSTGRLKWGGGHNEGTFGLAKAEDQNIHKNAHFSGQWRLSRQDINFGWMEGEGTLTREQTLV